MCAADSISYIMLYVVGHVIYPTNMFLSSCKAAHYNIVFFSKCSRKLLQYTAQYITVHCTLSENNRHIMHIL